MNLQVEIEKEEDNRWLAEIPTLPGVLAYGETAQEAIARAKALALRVFADRLEHGEVVPETADLFSVAACASGAPSKRAAYYQPYSGSAGVSNVSPVLIVP